MDIESLRRIQLAKLDQKARDMAQSEIEWLSEKYSGQIYTFEHNGVQVSASFLGAEGSRTSPPNSYRIQLKAEPSLVVDGQAFIIDSKGKRLGASASTARQQSVNRIILETLAVS